MTRRFRVIEGGLSDAGLIEAAAAPLKEPAFWRIDLLRPGMVGETDIDLWRAFLTRIRVPDPFYADPDYLLPAAQHQSGGIDLVFAFAWGRGTGRERLDGVLPLAMPHPLWGRAAVRVWQPPGTTLAPSIDPEASRDVRAALHAHLRTTQANATLHFEAFVPQPSAFERVIAPLRLARAARTAVPAASLVGVRPAEVSHRDESEIERISDPLRIRDAVEEFLALDARVSRSPIVADSAEAALVRVVTRRFAERRLASVELARRGGAVVGGSLRLGVGPRAIVWREAEDRSRIAPGAGRSARLGGTP